jgi:predicted nucleic acid-binding protein
MPARLKIDDIARLVGRTVFFDTIFFIDLFWPTGRNARADESARLFNACLERSIRPAVDFTVISEAINRILRIEYTKHLQTTGRDSERFSFKQYRDSPEGKDAQADIYQVIKKPLPYFSVYANCHCFGYSILSRRSTRSISTIRL